MKKFSSVFSLILITAAVFVFNSCSQLITPNTGKASVSIDLSAFRSIVSMSETGSEEQTFTLTIGATGCEDQSFTYTQLTDGFTKDVTFQDLVIGSEVTFTYKLEYGGETVDSDEKTVTVEKDMTVEFTIDSSKLPELPELTIPVYSISAVFVGEETRTLTAIDKDGNTVVGVTWTSSDSSIATVSNTGEVTAVAAGTVTIYAAKGGYKTATIQITVKYRFTIDFYVDEESCGRMQTEGDTTTYTMVAGDFPEDEPVKDGYTFKGWYNGETKVTAGYVINQGVTYSFTAKFEDSTPTEIELDGPTTVEVGKTIQLTSNVEGIIWSSTKTDILTVSQTGVVTGVAQGGTTVCGIKDGYAEAYWYVTVTAATVTGSDTVFVNTSDSYTPSVFSGDYLVKTTLYDAVSAVNAGGTIYITSNIAETSGQTAVTFSKNVTVKSYGAPVTVTTLQTMTVSGATVTFEGESSDNTLTFVPTTGNSQDRFINMSGTSTFNLNSNCIVKDYTVSSGLIYGMSSSTFNLNGGTITGCTSTDIGLIKSSGGTINLYYGVIESNKINNSTSSGITGIVYATGALYLGPTTSKTGNKLSLSNNESNKDGCAIYVSGTSNHIIYNDVEIIGNKSTSTSATVGGIYVSSCNFSIRGKGVTVKDNLANGSEVNVKGTSGTSFYDGSDTHSGAFTITADIIIAAAE